MICRVVLALHTTLHTVVWHAVLTWPMDLAHSYHSTVGWTAQHRFPEGVEVIRGDTAYHSNPALFTRDTDLYAATE